MIDPMLCHNSRNHMHILRLHKVCNHILLVEVVTLVVKFRQQVLPTIANSLSCLVVTLMEESLYYIHRLLCFALFLGLIVG